MAKANVTNGSVSEPEQTAAIPSGEGQIPSKQAAPEDGRGWENRAKEAERKLEALSEKHEATESRLNELDNMFRLTQAQQAEKSRLENKLSNIEAQKAELRAKQETQPWIGIAQEESMTAAQKAVLDRDAKLQEKFLKSKAKEHGMDFNKFVRELMPYATPYEGEYPLDKAEATYADWLDRKNLEKEKAELAAQKEKESQFREPGDRARRENIKPKSVHDVQNDKDMIDVTDNIFNNMGKYYPGAK